MTGFIVNTRNLDTHDRTNVPYRCCGGLCHLKPRQMDGTASRAEPCDFAHRAPQHGIPACVSGVMFHCANSALLKKDEVGVL
jgi:hypothetical protein